MQSLTKNEIGWMADLLEDKARSYRQTIDEADTNGFSALYRLKAEQFDGIAAKLRAAVDAGNKRIGIKY